MSGPTTAIWLEALLAQGDMRALLLDGRGRVQACSSALAEVLGAGREVLEGVQLADLVDVTQPVTAGTLEALVREAPRSAEVAMATRTGHRWMQLRSSPVPGGTLVVLTDAERVRGPEAELLRRLGEVLPGVMWTTDAELTLIGVIGGGLAMRNRTREELIGTHVFDYFGTHDPSASPVKAHLEALEGRTGRYELERAGRRFVARVDPVRDGDEVVGIVGIALEAAESEALVERLRDAHREQTVGRLAGSIAHEFNNLLTVIAAHAALLDEPMSEASRREDTGAIQQAASRGRLLTSRLLSLTERQIRQPRSVRLDAAVQQLEPMLRAILGERRRLELKTSPVPAWVRIDPGLFEQVVLSVVDNAAHATEETGRVSIDVGVSVDARSGREWVEARVVDDGVGMSEAVRARATEAFFTTRTAGRGTGLGLTNAATVVRNAGGVMQIESELGAGTHVTVRLPRSRAPSGVRPVAEKASEVVLLVEDQLGVRRAARRILRRAGYRVFEAAHAEDALALATTYPGKIDLLLTDVVMPGISGPQLAEQLVEQRPELSVLYMSGYAEDVDEVRAALSRGQTFLPKPFTPEGLLKRLREALGEGGEIADTA